ncbi:MAG TPA: glycoside hydrolase family 3 C-terminal domain-containing protein [Balneolaceae bacterium]|nr:glycoside hydrolase family 3 C-terminal domain-containing protein [Balneolaceae bacterium]
MKKLLIAVILLLGGLGVVSCSHKNKSMNNFTFNRPSDSTVTRKVNSLLGKLTLSEKIQMLGGTGFTTQPIKRLGIPPLKMVDGPLGVRASEISNGTHWRATAFPSGTAMAASWDTTLVHNTGVALGEELRGEGQDVLLGPNVNIARNPRAGRTFEGFGEDPYLTSRMGVNYIKGLQSQGVAATVKHLAVYTQEYHRMFINSKVNRRALHEIYFPAFKAAIHQGHTLALMSSYNKVNGVYASEDHYLLTDVLRNEWGYKNLVMSDWGAVHATMPTETSGQDLEMPTGRYLNASTIKPLLASGKVTKQHINQQVRHILRVIVSLGLMNHQHQKDSTLVNNSAHRKLARKVAREGIVLLENHHNLLPLDLNGVDTVTVMGPAAKHVMRGGGSSEVQPPRQVTPWQALTQRIGQKVALKYIPGVMTDREAPAISGKQLYTPYNGGKMGLKGEYYANNDFSGSPVVTRVDSAVQFGAGSGGSSIGSIVSKPDSIFNNGFSMRWTGSVQVPVSGTYVIDVTDNNGMRFYFNGKQELQAKLHYGVAPHDYKVHLKAGKKYPIRLDYYSRGSGVHIKLGIRRSNAYLIKKAVQAAKSSKLVLAFVGVNSNFASEGHDLESLRLPDGQDSLLDAVTKANSNTVVSVSDGEPLVMTPWNRQAGAVLDAWFGGEETGNAIADVLMGDYDPGGKLPITFPEKWSDSPAAKTYKQNDSTAVHQEGIYVGYRYFDEHNIKPEYPFGYGLSYTSFSFSNIKATKQDSTVKVTFTIKNTGKTAGQEVAQAYIHKENSSVKRAPHALKGFSRVHLSPGQSEKVTINFPRSQFAYYNTQHKKWAVEPGAYTILVGSSSRDLPLQTKVSW